MKTGSNEKTLWSIKEAAEQLSLSSRTIERMVSNRQIPFIKIGRLVRIPVDEITDWVAKKLPKVDNTHHARRDVPEKIGDQSTCLSVNQKVCSKEVIRSFGGSTTSTDAASELEKVLKLPTGKKQKRS
jgi:excisionase family DNA binding protein